MDSTWAGCVCCYLNSGFTGSRHGEWKCVGRALRLGEKVGVEGVLVFVFEDLERKKNKKVESLTFGHFYEVI